MKYINKHLKNFIQNGNGRALLSGAILPLGFAPFHLPGLTFIGLALFFAQLSSGLTIPGKQGRKKAFQIGYVFGFGYMMFGISWVYVSIHEYGHLNFLLSGVITLLFVSYLALFSGLLAYGFHRTSAYHLKWNRCLLFSSLWCLSEYLRSTVLTGFPWMLLGFGQIDTPLKYLLPIVGIYGVSFLTCLAASLIAISVQEKTRKSALPWIITSISLMIGPTFLNQYSWTTQERSPISVGVIQANLSMRDKWDESLFWTLVNYYRRQSERLMINKQLIVMPESAIPAPESYVSDLLDHLHEKAQANNTTILLGIPSETSRNVYYNSLIALGMGTGSYQKRHLVPFGEFIPKPFEQIIDWLSIPISNITSGPHNQELVRVDNHPIATLICYELAYPALLREQLPDAEWIVSISDDGWFGHSFAMYQQLQMAAALSIQTGRYQVVANNDGLSSVIDTRGNIIKSLPAYQAGILKSEIYASIGSTPWVILGDTPVILLSFLIVLISLAIQYKLHIPINGKGVSS